MMIELAIVFILGVILGSWLKEIFMRAIFREILKDLGITEQQLRQLARGKNLVLPEDDSAAVTEEDPPEIQIKIEEHQGQLYAFRMDNDQFLGQGADRDSLVKRIAEQYKGTRFRVPKDHGADLLRENNS